MAGSPARRTPSTMEDDLFSAETRRMPADVVRQVIRAVDERATLPPAGNADDARSTPSRRHPASGTRQRVSPDEIAAFIAARNAPPIVDTYAPEVMELPREVRDRAPVPEPPRPPAGDVVRTPPVPLASFPRGAYPTPRIEVPPQSLVERPVAVFFLAVGVVVVLAPLMYALLR